MKRLPSGDVLHELVQTSTYRHIGEKFGVSGAAVHKAYRNWAEKNEVDWRQRPVRNAIEEN